MLLDRNTLRNFTRAGFIFATVMIAALYGCNSDSSSSSEKRTSQRQLKESLFEANKKAVKTEDQQIEDFIRRHNWEMKKTGTGLRYRIYEKGIGKQAREGKIAVIDYEVSLLNGDVIYSAAQSGPKEFMIGRGGVESGLEEGILLLQVGDRAKFIIPSHLGYGLSGDENKITGKATLVYDLKLLELK